MRNTFILFNLLVGFILITFFQNCSGSLEAQITDESLGIENQDILIDSSDNELFTSGKYFGNCKEQAGKASETRPDFRTDYFFNPDTESLDGWLLDMRNPCVVLPVRIKIDGHVVGPMVAKLPSPQLQEIFEIDQNHGFSFPLKSEIFENKNRLFIEIEIFQFRRWNVINKYNIKL